MGYESYMEVCFEEQWGGVFWWDAPRILPGLHMKIQLTASGPDGLVQTFAVFGFMALTGIMRFLNTEAPEVLEEEEERDTSSEEGSDGYCPGPEKQDSTPAQFLFSKASLPS